MALLFLSLPPEVRNQIYNYLFDEDEIQLTHYYPEGYPVKNAHKSIVTRLRVRNQAELRTYASVATLQPLQFYAAMLQTSWQIYHETCYLLYARTIFRFFFLWNPKLAFSSKVFQKQSLQHVGDLKIELCRMDFVSLDLVVEAIAGLVDQACALERLTVEYDIYHPYIEGQDVAWVQSILHSEGVLKAITTSRSLRYVCIAVYAEEFSARPHFAALCQTIATAKGWVCEEQYETGEPDDANPDGYRCGWGWHLRPALERP